MKTFLFILYALVVRSLTPPKTPPSELIEGYTLNGSIPIEYFHVDDTNNGQPTRFSFSAKSLKSYEASAAKSLSSLEASVKKLDPSMGKSAINSILWNVQKELWLYLVFLQQDSLYGKLVEGKNTAVVGTMNPWVEALLVHLGAAHVTTIEYNELSLEHEKMKSVSASDFHQLYDCNGYYVNSIDMVISMSSLDHDGLGRYSDPLDPWGDIHAMKRLGRLLKPETGLLLLSVPLGPDVVVFNLHRRYGNIRLPLLLEGYQVVERFGWKRSKLTQPANWRQTYEPIFVLKRNSSYDFFSECPQASTLREDL